MNAFWPWFSFNISNTKSGNILINSYDVNRVITCYNPVFPIANTALSKGIVENVDSAPKSVLIFSYMNGTDGMDLCKLVCDDDRSQFTIKTSFMNSAETIALLLEDQSIHHSQECRMPMRLLCPSLSVQLQQPLQ